MMPKFKGRRLPDDHEKACRAIARKVFSGGADLLEVPGAYRDRAEQILAEFKAEAEAKKVKARATAARPKEAPKDASKK